MSQTIAEKIRLVFRKYPSCRFHRSSTYWFIGREFYGFGEMEAGREPLMSFFKDFSALERSVRAILREEEFKLPPEADAKRLEKESQFREQYKIA